MNTPPTADMWITAPSRHCCRHSCRALPVTLHASTSSVALCSIGNSCSCCISGPREPWQSSIPSYRKASMSVSKPKKEETLLGTWNPFEKEDGAQWPNDCLLEMPGIVRSGSVLTAILHFGIASSQTLWALAGEVLKQAEEFVWHSWNVLL